MLADAIEVYRSPDRASCAERAFVLTAVGVAHEMSQSSGGFSLWVAPANLEQARSQLLHYQQESRRRPSPAPPAPAPLFERAWVGSAAYALVLLGVAGVISAGWGRLDAFEAGELDAGLVHQGQWWRAWTALTLHLDAAHIAANLAAGAWFGYLAGRLLGPGTAWALVVLGAGAANWIEALLATAAHRSAGASTAVFTALGLLAAYSWRERHMMALRPAQRWGPLFAGVILLGWLGTSGEHTDVMAHLLGFAVGAVLGAVVAGERLQRLWRRLPQWPGAVLALGVLGIAWACA
ncbi:MAG TPA: rhomboid family intramembrane serine protease [Steroidobacteraceae bacterium]|nr:rhomboid family intramembrane serine protease [Steroidobacteraceae bacterium]